MLRMPRAGLRPLSPGQRPSMIPGEICPVPRCPLSPHLPPAHSRQGRLKVFTTDNAYTALGSSQQVDPLFSSFSFSQR